MLLIGNYNQLKISRITATGAFLSSEGGEILLPAGVVPKGAEPGSTLKVFIYVDSGEPLTATTTRPTGGVGDLVML